MRRFARNPGNQPVTVAVLQHQRGKHVPIPRGKAMHIMAIKPVALQALVEKILVLIEMARIGRYIDRNDSC
jgi:hypothetical protein